MKNLILVGGAMGVGKTTVCRFLQRQMPHCAFLDGDWCWDAQPFAATEETKAMAMDNIAHLLNNFLACTAYENVVFCWVMHRQEIWDDLLARIVRPCAAYRFALVCSPEALRQRLTKDIAAGRRREDILARSLPRLTLYEGIRAFKLDVSALTPEEAACKIRAVVEQRQGALRLAEWWSLVDERRRPLGRMARRGQRLAEGEYFSTVEIWTVNCQGEVLLTLRSPQKRTWPGMWENTGGAVVAGETSRQGAVRELREETGIWAQQGQLCFLGTRKRWNRSFMDGYLLRLEEARPAIVLQEGETADYQWVKPSALETLIRQDKLARPVAGSWRIYRSRILAALAGQEENPAHAVPQSPAEQKIPE